MSTIVPSIRAAGDLSRTLKNATIIAVHKADISCENIQISREFWDISRFSSSNEKYRGIIIAIKGDTGSVFEFDQRGIQDFIYVHIVTLDDDSRLVYT